MTDATEAPTRPDLSHLPEDVRLRIAVAETQGARWNGSGELWLRSDRLLVSVSIEGAAYATRLLPDYLDHPAAWGALMERERINAIVPFQGGWTAWHSDETLAGVGEHWAESAGRAVCLAVLDKHGVPWPSVKP